MATPSTLETDRKCPPQAKSVTQSTSSTALANDLGSQRRRGKKTWHKSTPQKRNGRKSTESAEPKVSSTEQVNQRNQIVQKAHPQQEQQQGRPTISPYQESSFLNMGMPVKLIRQKKRHHNIVEGQFDDPIEESQEEEMAPPIHRIPYPAQPTPNGTIAASIITPSLPKRVQKTSKDDIPAATNPLFHTTSKKQESIPAKKHVIHTSLAIVAQPGSRWWPGQPYAHYPPALPGEQTTGMPVPLHPRAANQPQTRATANAFAAKPVRTHSQNDEPNLERSKVSKENGLHRRKQMLPKKRIVAEKKREDDAPKERQYKRPRTTTDSKSPSPHSKLSSQAMDDAINKPQDSSSFAVKERRQSMKSDPLPYELDRKLWYESFTQQKLTPVPEDKSQEHPIREITSVDVLLGRGGLVNSHVGNIRYRKMIYYYKDIYAMEVKGKKKELAHYLCNCVRLAGGRFLSRFQISQPEETEWYEAGDDKAVLKCSQSLRESKKGQG